MFGSPFYFYLVVAYIYFMITFAEFMEIAINPDAQKIMKVAQVSGRSSSKIAPDESKFNIIPIRIGYGTYNVFKKNMQPNHEMANRLLDRRGSSVDWVTVKASNQEIKDLQDLANEIIANSKDDSEIRTAYATINAIKDSIASLERI